MATRRKISDASLESLQSALPERIPVMPLRNTVIFPTGATGLRVSSAPNVEVLRLQPGKSFVVGLVASDRDDRSINPASLEKVGVLARILNRLSLPYGQIHATIQGVIRIQMEDVRFENGYFTGLPKLVEEIALFENSAIQLVERILRTVGEIGARVQQFGDVHRVLEQNTSDPGRFADLVATLMVFTPSEKDEVLRRLDVGDRLAYVLDLVENWREHRVSGALRVGRLDGATNDQVEQEDKLGFMDYTWALASLIESEHTQPPLTIGIFGSWGAGKSFLLEHIARTVEARRRFYVKEGHRAEVFVVRFNAWEFNATELIWPGLVRRILDSLDAELSHGIRGAFARLRRRVWRNLRRAMREEWGELLAIVVVIFAIAFAVLMAATDLNLENATKWSILLGGGAGAVKLCREIVAAPLGQWITALFSDTRYGRHTEHMSEIRKDLTLLESQLRDRNGRMLVVIDDLDRCEPEKAVEVLQAINLLLNFRTFIVCLGIDARVITRALEIRYKEVFQPAGLTGFEYLDKIIQIPFRIPDPSSVEIAQFIDSLLGNPQPDPEQRVEAPSQDRPLDSELGLQSVLTMDERAEPPPSVERDDSDVPFTHAELTAFQTLIPYMRSNPRHLKRLINVYRLVRTLASRQAASLLKDPFTVMSWLLIASQWPYAMHAMLRQLDQLARSPDNAEGSRFPPGDALAVLYERAEPTIDPKTAARLDYDMEILRSLISFSSGALSWEALITMRRYAVNFNPAVESELVSHTGSSS